MIPPSSSPQPPSNFHPLRVDSGGTGGTTPASARHGLGLDLPIPATSIGYDQSVTAPANSVAAKLQQIISVKDAPFNALGDGVTDDTAAINLVEALPASVTYIYVPDGTYITTLSSLSKLYYGPGIISLNGVLSGPGGSGSWGFTGKIIGALTGNASTATALKTARTINGTSFDGTANITVTAAAGTLTGNTLASGVTTSSLTSLGTIVGLAFSSSVFESSEQTLTASTDTAVAHNLGRIPKLVHVVLRCKTAEFGYAVGDEAIPSSLGADSSTQRGPSIYVNSTNIGFVLQGTVSIIRRDGGSVGLHTNITLANWKAVLRAW